MKKNIFLIGCAVAATVALASCSKKYGYAFEDGYNPTNYKDTLVGVDLDTGTNKIDRSQFNQARVFPGLVGISEPRLTNTQVTLDLDYVITSSSDLRISVPPGGYFSTGMYAPAGERIEITVPQGVYGLKAQIGAWTDNLTGKDALKRAPIIYTRQELFPGKNYLRNLYGGHVWIIPPRPLGIKVTLGFTGTVKSPDFVLGETTNAQWKEMIAKTQVPWFELRGKRIIFTLEVSKLKRVPEDATNTNKFALDDPQLLMETWDKQIKEAYWDWYGLSENATDIRDRSPMLPWRIVHDIQPSVGAQHSGYPVVAMNTNEYFRQAVTQSGIIGQNWGTYHEIGHNMQMGSTWSFDGNGEVTNNLFSLKVTKMNGFKHVNYKRLLDAALAYINGPVAVADRNYSNNVASADAKLGMWVQLIEKYGYEIINKLAVAGRHAKFGASNNQDKIDLVYETISDYAHTDIEPFLNQWGLKVSSVSKNKITAKGYPLLTEEVWKSYPVN